MIHIAAYLQRKGKLAAICLLLGISLSAQSALDSGPWPTLGHDNQRTNQSNLPGPSSPGAPTILYDAGSPIGINQVVVTSDGKILITSCTNKLIAINANGQPFGQAWPFTFMQTGYPGSPETPVGITANNKGMIYASTHECPDIPGGVPAHFYSLQPGGTNTSNWPVSSHAMYWPAAVANDGTVYQMDEFAQIHSYSPQGQTLWSVNTSGYGQGDIALDFAGNIYAGTDGPLYGGHSVYAFSPSGVLRTNWPQDTGGVTAPTTPVVGPDGGIYIANNNGSLYAFNSDGSVRTGFPFNTGGSVSQQPLAVSTSGIVYMKTSLGLFAINTNGSAAWSTPFFPGGDSSLSPGPVLDAGGYIYVAFGDNIYSLNPDGTLRPGWPVIVPSASTLVIGGNALLYVTSGAQKLFSISDITPSGCSLTVPLLKQTSSLWGAQTFDNATNWAPPVKNTTIGAWGCNLTSVVMLINYQASQQGKPFTTDPETLNNWLEGTDTKGNANSKSYQTSGDIWGCDVARYATQNGVNLYYQGHISGQNDGAVAAYLCAKNPVVLSVPPPVGVAPPPDWSHFVLATGQITVAGTSTFSINDPYYGPPQTTAIPPVTTLQGYGFQYLGIGKYSASSPGLPACNGSSASVLITAHSPIELLASDPAGNRTGYDPISSTSYSQIPGSSYYTEAVGEDTSSSSQLTSPVVKNLEILTPLPGEYMIKAIGIGSGTFSIDFVSYDAAGSSTIKTISGDAVQGVVNQFTFSYATTVGSVPTVTTQCPGDLNGDGIVNAQDLDIIKASFGAKSGQPSYSATADVNHDGTVNVLDLAIVSRSFGCVTTTK